MHRSKQQVFYFFIIFVAVFTPFSFAFAADEFITLVQNFPVIGSNNTDIPTLLNGLFAITVGIAAILAVLEFIIGGFQYMSSEALSQKSDGKGRMESAVLGLVLILVSILILNTINPDITSLNIFRHVPADVSSSSNGNPSEEKSKVEKVVSCPAGALNCCTVGVPTGSTLVSEKRITADQVLCVYEI